MKLLISALFVITTLFAGIAQADTTAPAETATAAAAQVNINTADAKTLAKLDGIGESKAQSIIDFRDANGPFASVADLTKVKGIGERTLEQNQAIITVQ